MTNRLGKLPDWLRVSNGNSGDEPIENINVNTINLVAALIDKIQESGNYQNDWSDLSTYIGQFKMDEVLDGLIGRFDISDPKMMKGFQRSKGTISDLQYVTKILGINVDIYDADYYATIGIVNMLDRLYHSLFPDLISRGITDEQIIEWLGERVRVVNNRTPELVANDTYNSSGDTTELNPNVKLVVNYDRSSYEVLQLMGYPLPSPAQVMAFDDVLAKYFASTLLDADTSACSIVAAVSYDMDSSAFDPTILDELSSIFGIIVRNRLLPHIRVQGYTLNLTLVDLMNFRRIIEGDFIADITRHPAGIMTDSTIHNGAGFWVGGANPITGKSILDKDDGLMYEAWVGGGTALGTDEVIMYGQRML